MLEFPAVTFCNLNQFRRDRLPDEVTVLTDQFLETKRAELFGGQEAMDQFFGMLWFGKWTINTRLLLKIAS